MSTWLILLQTCWILGFIALGSWLWILSSEMLENLVPGVSAWKLLLLKRTPSHEQLNEKGQIIRRQFFRLLWVFLTYFIGGALLIDYAKQAAQ